MTRTNPVGGQRVFNFIFFKFYTALYHVAVLCFVHSLLYHVMLAGDLGGGRLSERTSEEGYYTDALLQKDTRKVIRLRSVKLVLTTSLL